MTNLTTLRAVLSRVESLKGPLTRGEAEKIADKLFMLSQDRVEWLDVVAALGGGRSALGAVVALVEREMPAMNWTLSWAGGKWRPGFAASANVCMPYSGRQDDEIGWPSGSAKGHATPAVALLAAYLRARIAEGEQP